jgi:pimeloyl-ACP methyl ester carboxylesterase
MKTVLAVFCLVRTIFAAEDLKPLGIGLEEVEYPYPVAFLPTQVEGEFVRMAYMAVNQSDRPTVVLLHGKNFYGAYWAGTIEALVNVGYRVIVPDQVGFGKSSKPNVHYTFDLMAELTHRILQIYGVKKFAVMGHSMGGMLAVHMAVKYPDEVTELILANPIGLEDYGKVVPRQSFEELFNKEIHDTDPEKLRAFFRRYVVEWKPEVYERFVETRARVTLSGEYPRWAAASARTYQTILEQPVVGEFAKVKARTLLIIGQKDRTAVGKDLVSKEVAEKMGNYPELGRATARAISAAKLVELPNAAHIPFLEAPEEFHREVLSFLKIQ